MTGVGPPVAPIRPDPDAMIWSRPAGGGRSLVLLLHGHGGVARDMTPFFAALPAGAVGVSVRGPVRLRDRWTWFDHPHRSDDHFDAAATGVLGWLDGVSGYDRVGAVGFSQGGALAVQLMRLAPGRLAFAVQVCGFVFPGPRPLDPSVARLRPPVLAVHGGRDDVVADLRDAGRPWLRAHTDLTEIERPELGDEISDAVVEDVARYLGR